MVESSPEILVPKALKPKNDWLGINEESFAFLKRLPSKRRGEVMKDMGEAEWCKCRDNIFYWLDPTLHMKTDKFPLGMPYVFTHDPHPLFQCSICSFEKKNYYTFNKLGIHLKLFHDRDIEDPYEQRNFFNELPSTRPFPLFDYVRVIAKYWLKEPMLVVAKSRDMVATWTICMLYAHDTLYHEGAQNIFQSGNAAKAYDLVKRAYIIYQAQPKFLQRPHPAKLAQGHHKGGILTVPSMNSEITGFPQDPDQIRQFHPRGLFQDEAAFLPSAAASFAASKPTIQNGGRYTAISSANPGWFQMVYEDRLDEYQTGE